MSYKITDMRICLFDTWKTTYNAKAGDTVNTPWQASIQEYGVWYGLLDTVSRAMQIHHDVDGGVDDGCGDRHAGQRNSPPPVHHQKFVSSSACPRLVVSRQQGPSMSARVQTESHFHQNECSGAASDGQNIYCRCVINNVGTGARFRLRECPLSPAQRPKDLYTYCSSGADRPRTDGARYSASYWQPVCGMSERRLTSKPYSTSSYTSSVSVGRHRTSFDCIVTYDAVVSTNTADQRRDCWFSNVARYELLWKIILSYDIFYSPTKQRINRTMQKSMERPLD